MAMALALAGGTALFICHLLQIQASTYDILGNQVYATSPSISGKDQYSVGVYASCLPYKMFFTGDAITSE